MKVLGKFFCLSPLLEKIFCGFYLLCLKVDMIKNKKKGRRRIEDLKLQKKRKHIGRSVVLKNNWWLEYTQSNVQTFVI